MSESNYDVSGNEDITHDEVVEDEDTSSDEVVEDEDTSSDEVVEDEDTSSDEVNEDETTTESVVYVENSIDYTPYLENITSVAIFQCALIIAVGCIIAWVSKK